jgi:hypothetical protein
VKTALPTEQRCVNAQGFSLHAEVCCAADQRKKLEHLCRYITRPAIANERLTLNRAGDVVLQLKSPYHDGTTHVVMSPLEFMQRLAALVPRPRLHLIRFHGVLAPNARLRPEIIPSPGGVKQATLRPLVAKQAPSCAWLSDRAGQRPYPLGGPRRGAPSRGARPSELGPVVRDRPGTLPHCGGPLTIIAAIEHPPVIAKILAHLGLPARAPPRSPARSFDRFPMA